MPKTILVTGFTNDDIIAYINKHLPDYDRVMYPEVISGVPIHSSLIRLNIISLVSPDREVVVVSQSEHVLNAMRVLKMQGMLPFFSECIMVNDSTYTSILVS